MRILGCLFLLFGLLKAKKCNMPMDVAVVVDVSDKLATSDFPDIKNFVSKIGYAFHVSPHASHISVVLAGDSVTIPINFEFSGTNRKTIIRNFDAAQIKLGGSWSLDRAFSVVEEKVFSREGGARNFLPHILIVVTNGRQEKGDYTALAKAAKLLHDKKIRVYSVGVGGKVPPSELRSMVEDESRIYQANTFKGLVSLAPKLSDDICKNNTGLQGICNAPLDVGFIVDSSGSISDRHYRTIKDFVKGISLNMGFKPGHTHVGLVLYSDRAGLSFKFGRHPTIRKLFRAVYTLPHWVQTTRIDLGLQTANISLFSREGGMRENVSKIAILLTDGKQTTQNITNLIPLPEAANALKRRGIRVFVVGIGKNVDEDELLQIVEKKDDLILIRTYDELEDGMKKISKYTCEQVVGITINFTKAVYNFKENEKAVVQVVVTTGEITTPVTVVVTTRTSTAGNDDFIEVSERVRFEPGETGPKSVPVTLNDDRLVEPIEVFTVALASSSPVILGKPASVNIIDNDVPPICGTERDDCHEFATCTDFGPGRYECNCNEGYTGDGKRCTVNKICGTEREDCHKLATCTDTGPGSHKCTCKQGYSGDGKTCKGISIDFTQRAYNVKENETYVVVEIVLRSGPITSPVTVGMTTRTGTAGAEDFIGQSKTITFRPGNATRKSVVIDVVDDLEVERTEVFKVVLTSSLPIRLGRPALVYILDNDEPPICGTEKDDCHRFADCTDNGPGRYTCTCREGYSGDGKTCLGVVIGFTRNVYNVRENERAVVRLAVNSGSVTSPVAISVVSKPSTAGKNDFVATSERITFEPGETGPKSIGISLVDDPHVEQTETFKVLLSSSSPGVELGQPASVNILDNDEAFVNFTKRAYNVKENEKAVVEVIITSGKLDTPVTIRIVTTSSTAANDDFIPKAQDVTFRPGETGPKSVEIELVDDLISKPIETFKVSFVSSSLPGVKLGKPASVNILDNDEPPICGTEKDDCHRFAVCTDDGPGRYTCTCREGYSGDGKTCLGPVIGFMQSVHSVKENEKAVVQIGVTSGKLITPVTVRVSTSPMTAGNEDFIPKTQDITFKPGETGSKLLEIDLVDDLDVESSEAFLLVLSSNSPGIRLGEPATVNILDNDVAQKICGTEKDDCHKFATCNDTGPGIYHCTCNVGYSGDGKTCRGVDISFKRRIYNVKEDGKAVIEVVVSSGKVTIPVVVRMTTSPSTAGNNDFVPKTKYIRFEPGEAGPKLVEIDLVDDSNVEGAEEFKVSLIASSSSGVKLGKPATVNILDNDGGGCALDIGFLIDSTGSMRNCNFEKEKSFVKEIGGYFRIAPQASRTSLIAYSKYPVLIKRFNETETLTKFKADVDELPLYGGRAQLDKALCMAASTMFTKENGMRSFEVPKVLLVLNDGTQTAISQSAKEAASMLREREVRVVVIGVGEADRKQLGQLVATPDDLIMVEKFEDAREKLEVMSKELCPSNGNGNCSVLRHATKLRIAGCVSLKPVEIGVCHGECPSGSLALRHNGVYKVGGKCCKPKTTATRKVFLHCSMNTTKAFDIQEAASCACK